MLANQTVSTTGNWFRLNSYLPLGKRRSSPPNPIKLSAEPTPATSKRLEKQKTNSKNLAVPPANLPVIPVGIKTPGKSLTSKLPPRESGVMPTMSTSTSTPIWLLRLSMCHRYSSVVAFLFVAATLSVYGWTVYSQELWGKAYQRVQNLHRYERQLTTTNATLTNKLANEAEQPTTGLVSPNPEGTIFLTPASRRPHPRYPQTSDFDQHTQNQSPLGY